ncbi:MAG: acetyl xylan esterase [Myxococcales bacterium]|nr:acetyl xylan esterase [Myxococcales bacterium]
MRRQALLLGLVTVLGCSGSADPSDPTTTDADVDTGTEVDSATADAGDSSPSETSTPVDTGTVDAPTDTPVEAGKPEVRFVGRFDTTDPAGPKFEWSGSQIIARFTGTAVRVKLKANKDIQFAVTIDGGAPTLLKPTGASGTYTLATGLAAGSHDVVLWRRTEAFFNDAQFLGFEFDGGGLQAPPPAPAKRIEVIGDSISAGYGNEGTIATCSFSSDTENHFLSYEALAARAKGADLVSTPWSGIGMYRSYDGSTTDQMPVLYERTLPTIATSKWDFAKFAPDAVVINLGTNDFAKGDPGTPFRDAYLKFVRRVRSAYPKAWIFPALGSMLSGTELDQARKYLQAVIATPHGEGDTRVSLLEFATQLSSDGYGCDYHPNKTTHGKMAKVLGDALTAKLGW